MDPLLIYEATISNFCFCFFVAMALADARVLLGSSVWNHCCWSVTAAISYPGSVKRAQVLVVPGLGWIKQGGKREPESPLVTINSTQDFREYSQTVTVYVPSEEVLY